MENTISKIEAFKLRTKKFAIMAVNLFQKLPKTGEAQIIGKQFLRSATSVAANYRASCRARSSAEFYSKICIVVEEADETLFWLELIKETNILKGDVLEQIMNEAEELVKITTTIKANAKK